jgi:hypothetical protein
VTATDEALKQLDALLDEYNKTLGGTRGTNSAAVLVMIQRFLAAIQRLVLPTSTYAQSAARQAVSKATPTSRLIALAAIVRALHDDIAAGWLASVVEQAHAETYTDYLSMAEGLIGQGYKDAAAVIAGTSLEVHLKALAVKHGVSLQAPNGSPRMASGLNDELKRQSVYNAVEHKQVTAWLAIRNAAAHGNYVDYDEAAVKGLVEGVGNFAVRHPA